jgi:hypothetical protein
MMTALLSEPPDRVERRRGSFGVDEAEEHRTGNSHRSEGDEYGDGDRLVGLVESRLGDGRGGGERERQVLRVRPGEVAAGIEPRRVIEAVIGPIHLRLLLTGEPVDDSFLEGIVDVVVNGVARRPRGRHVRTAAPR